MYKRKSSKNIGSKKKMRKIEYQKRLAKRISDRTRADIIKNAKTMEEMAGALGIPLR